MISDYSNFTGEEARSIGTIFKAKCLYNSGYEHQLTEGKEYEIRIEEAILTARPLCSWIGDDGKRSAGHLRRFHKL